MPPYVLHAMTAPGQCNREFRWITLIFMWRYSFLPTVNLVCSAGYSSSGVVEAISNFVSRYFLISYSPLLYKRLSQYMPQNCSADVIRVISHMDEDSTSGNDTQIVTFKTQFGIQNIHLDDVASAMRRPVWSWQDSPTVFQEFCDTLEASLVAVAFSLRE